jgi:hypothetical protein
MSVMTGPTRLAAKLPTRLLATFAAAWAGVAASPALARAAYVRVVGASEKPTIGGSWRALSFGLSSAQREELYRLTRGAVDLRGMYRVDTDDAHGYSDVTAQRGVKWLGVADRRAVSPLAGADGLGAAAAAGAPQTLAAARRSADPALDGEWWVKDLNTSEAWRHATGRGVTIADCDSGWYVEEGDIRGNLRLDLAHDFADRDDPTNVTDGRLQFHGTAVAAIMVGVRDGVGTNGIAYDARLIPLQNYNYDREIDDGDKEEATAECILHAIALEDVDVIVVQNQTTQGSSETFAGTRDAIRLAVMAGIPVVAAAGNSSLPLDAEAADDTGSVIVGALRQDGRRANFSNFGPRVSIAAFGENLSTLYGPAGRMDTFGGTTGAAAQVGGAVALMKEVNPLLTPAQVRALLESTRVIIGDNDRVGGQLDILAAVRAAATTRVDDDAHERAAALRERVRAVLH